MEQSNEPVNKDSGSARLRVLEMIDEGTITAEEGLRLLQAFSAADAEMDVTDQASTQVNDLPQTTQSHEDETEIPLPSNASNEALPSDAAPGLAAPTPEATGKSKSENLPVEELVIAPVSAGSVSPVGLPADAQKWKRWWMVVVWTGVAITVIGGLLMYLAMNSSGTGFWFFCASLPFILGVLVIVLGWGSRTAPWLHLRIQQPPGEKPQRIALSLPLPVRPAVWFIRTFGRWIPGLEDHSWDEVILAIGDKTSPDNPLYIIVDEDKTGEKVEIYIG
jgi:hypothetical protein